MSRTRLGTVLLVALRYLRNRRFATWVSMAAIGLSLTVVVGVALVNFAVKKAAVQGAIRYPLIVGPESASSVQLIFSTIFHIDKPIGTIDYTVYEQLAGDRRVLAAYPLAVADSLEAYPIVGTNQAYLEDLEVGAAAGTLDLSRKENAVLGAEVALRTGLELGDVFRGSHGMIGGEHAHEHAELDYRVVGILGPTGGPEDAAVYCAVQAVWAIHAGGKQDRAESSEHRRDADHSQNEVEGSAHHNSAADAGDCSGSKHSDKHSGAQSHRGHDKYDLHQGKLTAVLVRTANPVYSAQLESEMTLQPGTQGVDTGRAIRRLVSYMKQGERIVEVFSTVTLLIAMTLILVTLVMSLSERRKELALMRSLGIGRLTISSIIMAEALVITLGGTVIGLFLGHCGVWWAVHPIRQSLGVTVEPWVWTSLERWAVVVTLGAGQLLALVSLFWTYRMNLVEEVARD